MIKQFAYLALVSLFISCNSDDNQPDCSAVSCMEPTIIINLLDSATNENIIINNNIPEDAIIINDTSETPLNFYLSEPNGLLLISKRDAIATLDIRLNNEVISNISYKTSAPNTDACCDFGSLTDVIITEHTFDIENNTITIYL